mmetsp:Transcript_4385/g.9473  ORF Transcript_4385/g.9473 Transcript_4385/m.9473 type:complete len:511 (-) Transcript_4385:247-1779(-)|eukprot:CAMPEP_0172528972 /NCGR_PEP_ID=MMETSP1067-20121228/3168_1 /TAXON_ID=265564 ORGANISM="Thalassiosira punctigera, Strain Tpunct2005C2" /NCGR_SAMPLE_ID=MMETSP1067 /ASSEMBLY_ACC=CAM_ASM_000444 /LENGTH=510 /DNA_ID=CAMNT_0013312953 /DNA_START=170 /DNA_END=1702 /DNA_ORIENTATION=+
MAEDPASRSKYKRRPKPPAHYEEYEGKLRKKNATFRKGNDVSQAREDVKKREEEIEDKLCKKSATAGENIAGPEKRPHAKGQNGLHKHPNGSGSDGITLSDAEDTSKITVSLSTYEDIRREEANGMQSQERRRTKRRDRRAMLDEKIEMALASGVILDENEEGPGGDSNGRATPESSDEKASRNAHRDPFQLEASPDRDGRRVKRERRGKKKRDGISRRPKGDAKGIGPDEENRLGRTEPAKRCVRFLQFAESRRANDPTQESGTTPEGAEDGAEASKSKKIFFDRLPGALTKANSFRFERSDSVISWSDLDGALVQAEMESLKTSGVGPSKIPAKFDESSANLDGIPETSEKIPELTGSASSRSFRFERGHSVKSWADLNADIERALLLSIKENDCEALKLQVELETFTQAGTFDVVESQPPEEGGADDGPVVARAKARARRGKKKKKPRNDETFAYKMDSIMEVMEGTETTRFDVLNALKKTKGHREEALGLLLGSQSSSFTNRPTYN